MEALRNRGFFIHKGSFTRERKLGFEQLVTFMLRSMQTSATLALERFFREQKQEVCVRQQSYSEARNKVDPAFFRGLFEISAQTSYEVERQTWRGYRVSAIDGTHLALPNCLALKLHFGTYGRGNTSATARASILYDVLNKVVLDAQIAPVSVDERTLALRHLSAFEYINKQDKELFLFDRGYPSWEMIASLQAAHLRFLMRVPSSFNPQITALAQPDSTISIQRGEKTYTLRVLKFLLPSGEQETLLTDLFDESLTCADFRELYFFRWPVETKYDELKNKLQIENFSGRTVRAITQDFFITMYLSNLAAMAWWEGKELSDLQRKGKQTKYRYIPNMSHAIATVRDFFAQVLLSPDPFLRSLLFERIVRSIAESVVPVRPERSVPRSISPRNSKFHHNSNPNF